MKPNELNQQLGRMEAEIGHLGNAVKGLVERVDKAFQRGSERMGELDDEISALKESRAKFRGGLGVVAFVAGAMGLERIAAWLAKL